MRRLLRGKVKGGGEDHFAAAGANDRIGTHFKSYGKLSDVFLGICKRGDRQLVKLGLVKLPNDSASQLCIPAVVLNRLTVIIIWDFRPLRLAHLSRHVHELSPVLTCICSSH